MQLKISRSFCIQGGKYGKQEVNNLKLSLAWKFCVPKAFRPPALLLERGPLWIPLSPLQNSVTYNFCHREMMFARSLLIQFQFFIHKRRVAAVGAKFPFSLVRARPPSSSVFFPYVYIRTVRAVLVFFHPLCTHREDKMCMQPAAASGVRPTLARWFNFQISLICFSTKLFKKIFREFSLPRCSHLQSTYTKRATRETIRNLAVPRGCCGVIPNQTYMTLHFGWQWEKEYK
jgi:hypothetical protein